MNGDRIGAALDAALRPAEGLALDGDALVFSDSANFRVRQLSLAGSEITTLAGDGNSGASLGSAAVAHVAVPRGLCRYRSGFAVADSADNRVVYVER